MSSPQRRGRDKGTAKGMKRRSSIEDELRPGVWGVVATPFHGSGLEVDVMSLSRTVEHYLSVGAVGVVVLGVFGEAASLDADERATVIDTALGAAAGLPIVVGATSLSTAPAIEEARRAVDLAGDQLAGVMLQVNSTAPDVLAQHLRAVHEASGARIVIQHYPDAGGRQIDAASLVRVLNDVDCIVGAKCENAPTPPEIEAIVSAVPVPAFGGLGGTSLLDELSVGAAGAMTGFSCPEGLVACVDAYLRNGLDAARDAWLPYLPLVNFEFQRGFGLAIRKESLRLRGLIAESRVRSPARPMPPSLLPLLQSHLNYALSRGGHAARAIA